MKINKKGLDLIKKYEGCRLKSYYCPAGVLTIGYGHTGKDVKKNQTITLSEAEALLKKDLAKFEKIVDKYNEIYHFNENEFSALVSFAYNIGNLDGLTSKGKRTRQEIMEAFPKYCNANGKRLLGLVNRRNEELRLFKTKVFDSGVQTVTVNVNTVLNLRDNPSMNGKVIYKVPNGTVLEKVAEYSSDWIKIKYEGKELYCSRKWVI